MQKELLCWAGTASSVPVDVTVAVLLKSGQKGRMGRF